jgi:hypothetical protein
MKQLTTALCVQIPTVYASCTCTNISSEKMSQHMEIASNIQTKKFWAECSTQWPSAQYFRSIIQPNYQLEMIQFALKEAFISLEETQYPP